MQPNPVCLFLSYDTKKYDMGKNTYFTGQPIFNQLIKFIDKKDIGKIAKKYGAERYVKKFTTYNHVVVMLFAALEGYQSIREVILGLLANAHKLSHLGLSYVVRRSTLSEANQRRNSLVFGEVYQSVYQRHAPFLTDSRLSDADMKRLYIMDSTTISLFKEVLKGVGRHREEFDIPEGADSGVLKDEGIILFHGDKKQKGHRSRRIAYWDSENGRLFEFITNNFELPAEKVAMIYKKRWQIELLFKQLKQNFPLKYFLGDNENAIELQIWAAMLANLLITLVQGKVKRKWAFSNLVSLIRQQLMNYVDVYRFMEDPEGTWRSVIKENKLSKFPVPTNAGGLFLKQNQNTNDNQWYTNIN